MLTLNRRVTFPHSTYMRSGERLSSVAFKRGWMSPCHSHSWKRKQWWSPYISLEWDRRRQKVLNLSSRCTSPEWEAVLYPLDCHPASSHSVLILSMLRKWQVFWPLSRWWLAQSQRQTLESTYVFPYQSSTADLCSPSSWSRWKVDVSLTSIERQKRRGLTSSREHYQGLCFAKLV